MNFEIEPSLGMGVRPSLNSPNSISPKRPRVVKDTLCAGVATCRGSGGGTIQGLYDKPPCRYSPPRDSHKALQ